MKSLPDYVSLTRMTLSEATDYDYRVRLSGYQLKLLMWALFYIEKRKTGLPQLDYPKSQWGKMRLEIQQQIDGTGTRVDADPLSDNHLDVVVAIEELDDAIPAE